MAFGTCHFFAGNVMRIKRGTGEIEPLRQKPESVARKFGVGGQIGRLGDEQELIRRKFLPTVWTGQSGLDAKRTGRRHGSYFRINIALLQFPLFSFTMRTS